MKIFTIIGARPQIIKSGMISQEIDKREELEEVVVHTGQHFDDNMSDVFFRQMNIKAPKYNLGLDSLSHGAMIGRMLEELEKIMLQELPNVVLLIGDTNSTLAGAIAARKLNLFVAHIESGVRSYDRMIPEEANRLISDHMANILFCSNPDAIKSLSKEGIVSNVHFSGDVMKDAAMYYKNMSLTPKYLDLDNSEFVLATCHRAENTNNPKRLKEIFAALEEINSNMDLVMPLHPRTKNKLEQYRIKPKFKIIEPVGYLQMLWLLEQCKMVITDSGGLPKEAFFFKKPCLVMRPKIEWTELVNHGCTDLIPILNCTTILETYQRLLNKAIPDYSFYGVGKASKFIIDKIMQSQVH